MGRTVIRLSAGFAICVLSSVMLWGQGTAQISGTVRDQTGAVLPGVEVAVTQTDTGISRSAVSNETGSYVLPNLVVGPYRVEASLPGFRTFVQTGLVLQVNGSSVINPVLQVGEVTEQVEVQANAALVETRSSSVGQVIENQRILELPLNGRNVTELITLAGAAVQTAVTADKNFQGSAFVSWGGGLGTGTAYNLDGASHMNFITGTGMPMPFPDALQEFKVETTGVSAQYGATAAVSALTKSGTNELHGDLFEFVRNDLFNARSYFATTNSSLKRNQFGGTLGGPILKNKLFFFAGYQGTTLRQDPADTRAFVPTAAMMAGDWTAFASPDCNAGRQITLRTPFVNNRIDPALYSKPALNIVARLNGITPDACGQVTYGRLTIENAHQAVGKIDYQWSDKHSLFGRYIIFKTSQPNPFRPENVLTSGNGNRSTAQSFAIGDTYLIGPNTVHSFRLAVNRASVWLFGNEFFSACDVGINIYCGWAPKRIGLSITGGFSLSSRSPDDNKYFPKSYQVNDDLSLIRGTHQVSFGANLMYGTYDSNSHFTSSGTMTFNAQETGLGMGDFMLGKLTQLTMGAPIRHYLRQSLAAVYATDTWKVKPNLTLNSGLRWEPYLPQVMTNGRNFNFDYDRYRQGIQSTVFKNAPVGIYYPGDPGFPGLMGVHKQWLQFAPRVGLAWDVHGDGRTSVRASYALSYIFINAQWREDYSNTPPWGNNTTITSVPLENPWQNFPGGSPFPPTSGADAKFSPYGLYQTMRYDVRTPSLSTWNLSLQRQVATDWLLSASYIGNQTVHLWSQNAINPAIFLGLGSCTINGVAYNPCSTTANTNQRRRFSLERPQDKTLMGQVADLDDGGTQNYGGMLLSVQRRAAQGVTISGNYTWSHCIGNYADINSVGPDANEVYTHPNDRDADRGNCNSDRRHIFNLTAVAETPQFSNQTVRLLATGWRLSGIYRRSSGVPFTVIAGSDRALIGVDNQRANQVLADPYGDKSGRPLTNYLNPAAFALPALGTIGNVGRGSIQGPPTWAFDAALSRIFRVGETHRLEFRAEAYNVTNSFRPSIATTGSSLLGQSLASNTFGQIRNSLDPRIMQFALKYVF